MPLEAAWSGPLGAADRIPLLRALREPRATRCRPGTAGAKALRLAQPVTRLWRRGNGVSGTASGRSTGGTPQRVSASQPRAADLDIAVRYQPADPESQIGGDWYDAFVDASSATVLTVGDVSGHDRKAAATMSQVHALWRGLASEVADAPSRLLSRLDAAMTGLPSEPLATAVVARVEPPSDHPPGSRRVHWSSAGHVPPLLRDPDGGVTRLEAEPDLLLGISPDAPRKDHFTDLLAGSTLLLYTDGLIERRDQDLDDGIDDLANTLSNLGDLDPGSLCEAIEGSTTAFQAGEDDIVLLVLRATG